jgi:hypothetical protein
MERALLLAFLLACGGAPFLLALAFELRGWRRRRLGGTGRPARSWPNAEPGWIETVGPGRARTHRVDDVLMAADASAGEPHFGAAV